MNKEEKTDLEGNVYVRCISMEFATHKLNSEGMVKACKIGEVFDDLLMQLHVLCLPGREFSIAKTKLEEACFFAKKAMAINLANQETK